MAADIYGIGFLTADKIARNIGIAPNSEFRYRAGIIHCLSEAAEDGHCYLPQSQLIDSVIKLLTTESHQPTEEAFPLRVAEGIALIIKDMALADDLIRERDEDKTLFCYKPTYFHTDRTYATGTARSPSNSTKVLSRGNFSDWLLLELLIVINCAKLSEKFYEKINRGWLKKVV